MSIDNLRHHEIINARDFDPDGITVIGAGAIGSKVWSMLFELGFTNMAVWDFDKVEAHNVANQLYTPYDIGVKKTHALKLWAERKWGGKLPESLRFHDYRFDVNDPDHYNSVTGTLFLLVDSLEERRKIASAYRDYFDITNIIDVRMASTHGNVFNVPLHTHLDEYLATLGNDEEAEVSACGSPFSVPHTGWMLASFAVGQFVNNCVSPAGTDQRLNIFLNPVTVNASKLQSSNAISPEITITVPVSELENLAA